MDFPTFEDVLEAREEKTISKIDELCISRSTKWAANSDPFQKHYIRAIS
jgi:hypothetical protein